MKTMIFCTSYITDINHLNKRYKMWYDFYRKVTEYPLFFIDDASPFDVKDVDWINSDESKVDDSLVNFHTFPDHLGFHKNDKVNFHGWFRSFHHSITIAKKLSYDRIIHLESDLYVLKKTVFDELCELKTGWNVAWCPRHKMAETAIQVIGSDQFDIIDEFMTNYRKKEKFVGPIEHHLPFTNVIKKYNGDRYGETLKPVDDSMDFYAQYDSFTLPEMI